VSDRLALRRDAARAREAARAAPLEPADLGWILLLPVVVVAVPAIALLAPLGGRLLLPDPGYHYWVPGGVRKPAVHVGYALFVVFAVAYGVAVVKLARLRVAPPARRALVALAQAAALAFVVVCWVAQRHDGVGGTTRMYFTPATLAVAGAATAAVALLPWLRRRWRADPLAPLRRADPRVVSGACLAAALLATVVWLLPAIHTDRATPSGEGYLGALFLDESTSVLNGRSPLVDMVAYGTLWAYVVALPLRALGGGYAAFTVTMATIAGVSMLAVHGVLQRVARDPLLALGLYLPVLATGFFVEHQIGNDRYDPGTYFGMFPLRYGGPYLLAWLTVRQLASSSRSRWPLRLLFAVAGLVALNNLDFGGAALAATATALLVVRRPRDGRALARLALDAGAGLVLALALVSLLTLVRAGSLPQLGLLTRYGRVFVDGGAENLPLPRLGLHLVVSATFVAAGTAAAVRVVRAQRDDLLAGMLAWCAIFGLGASLYYYGYRSHPDVLVSLFSIWSLTLALLVLAVLRGARPRRRPSVPALAVAFGFALAACSLVQAPSPWSQLRRIAGTTPAGAVEAVPAEGFREAAVAGIVAERTRTGERVVILSQVGHRVAREAGVVNVSPYTGLEQMPAREQLDETAGILVREGGTKLFVAQQPPPGIEAELRRLGFRVAGRWSVASWPVPLVTEYRAA
jgi:hypothetical protein